jgi:ferredoxin
VIRQLLAGLLLGAAAVALWLLVSDHQLTAAVAGWWRPIGIAGLAVIAFAALIALLSPADHRSPALLRLDWFLPQLRRVRSGEPTNTRWLGRLLQRLLPSSLRSDRNTKKRGLIRRSLRHLGLSWLASPPRRVIQATCLIVFLISFFYICWPYDAQPAPPAQVSRGWRLTQLDQASGEIFLSRTAQESWLAEPRDELFLGLEQDTAPVTAACPVVANSASEVTLRVEADFPDELFDALLTGADSWLLCDADPNAWPSHYADNLAAKEKVAAELFLVIDPLVSLSTAIASRSWVWSLFCAAIILIVCLLIPRGFCGYLCPLGTTIDLFDWLITRRTKKFQVPDDGWWVHIKYYLLGGTLVAATCGVLVSGFVAAIPVITRGLLFVADPFQNGFARGWHLVPAMGVGQVISIGLFLAVLCLGFLRPRFWCKYVCPSGAVFSLGNLFRISERKVESSCIHCNKCVEICPFDAIKPDFTTRGSDCTMCQSCGGVCPTHAIKFVERWNVVELKVANDPPTNETALGRRGFLSLATGTAAATVGGLGVAGGTKLLGANLHDPQTPRPVRPPGSVPEQEFLQMCIRCGECFKACPNNVLQPQGFQQGLEGLWTPEVVADWAGCESSCNACGQVCPTGAIRALPLQEKKAARMGLAIVNEQTCLPFAGQEDCDLCVQECHAAGYHAIEYIQVGTQVDDQGQPIAGSGMLAPVVLPENCVGCGLCQTRCHAINVKDKGLLSASAIIIEAGEGKEDRLIVGSYRQLRQERGAAATEARKSQGAEMESADPEISQDQNPFGL